MESRRSSEDEDGGELWRVVPWYYRRCDTRQGERVRRDRVEHVFLPCCESRSSPCSLIFAVPSFFVYFTDAST